MLDIFRTRPARVLIAITTLVIAALIAMSAIIARNLREDALQTAEVGLSRYSLTLAGQAERSFQSVELVLANLDEYLRHHGVFDSASYKAAMAQEDVHKLLKEKLIGLPQLDAITMIDADGRLINFSRYWPIPDVNISDRDYYKQLRDHPELDSYIGKPVENRGTGTWTIYLARRVSGPNREFNGLLLAAMSLNYFEQYYESISLGEGSAQALMRTDGTLLARYPKTTEIGKVFNDSKQRSLFQTPSRPVREISPIDQKIRIKAAQPISGQPLIILTTQTEETVLSSWRKTVELMTAFTGGMILLLFLAAGLILRKWRQQELLKQAETERANAERAKALAETELLREQERAAEEASRTKSHFLAMMSHEIRTPLTAVLGLTSALLETRLDEEQRSWVDSIHSSGDNLLEILNDILDFTKLEFGNLQLEESPFSPEDTVDNALSLISSAADLKGIKVRKDIDPNLPRVILGDGGRIRQVLLNLLSNAVKFTPSGEVHVDVRCISKNESYATLCWSIADTGIGIPQDRIGMLFNDFVQVDSSVNRRFGGSGLGLAICRRIVEQMEGKITVASQPGLGSTFSFEVKFPISDQGLFSEVNSSDAVHNLASSVARFERSLRILIVDDNATNRLVARKMLQGIDFVCTEAADGNEAVAAASSAHFDLILMDMQMPEMDGLTATRRIRELDCESSTAPIIAFTANAFSDDREACHAAGMNGFVSKPIRKTLFFEAIVCALHLKGRGRTDPTSNAKCELTELENTMFFEASAFNSLIEEIDHEGANETFDLFVQDTTHRLSLISNLDLTTMRSTLKLEAHSLKGSAATFGLHYLAKLARGLETAAATMDTAELARQIELLGVAFNEGKSQFLQTFRSAA